MNYLTLGYTGVDFRPPEGLIHGTRDGYRVRVGDYRALYLVDEEAQEVTVYRVAHRREVYRRI